MTAQGCIVVRMTQTFDPKFNPATDPEWTERMAACDARFVEIVPVLTPYGPEFPGLDFDDCVCSQCETPVGGHLTTDEQTGCDYATSTDVFMDADWELWCEDCSWDVACEEVMLRGSAARARHQASLVDFVTDPYSTTRFAVATDRREDEPCQAGTPGCCVDHKGGERCETW